MAQRSVEDRGGWFKATAAVADMPRRMRKKFLMIVVVLAVALVSNSLGFARGFAKGLRHTNIWWVDQKSIYFDTHEILQKRQLKKHDCL